MIDLEETLMDEFGVSLDNATSALDYSNQDLSGAVSWLSRRGLLKENNDDKTNEAPTNKPTTTATKTTTTTITNMTPATDHHGHDLTLTNAAFLGRKNHKDDLANNPRMWLPVYD